AVPWRVFSAAGFQERNCQAPHLPGAGSEAAVPGRTPHAHDRRLRHGRPERRPGHGRGGYRRSAVDDMKEVAGLLAFPGFWRVMRNHAGSAVTELKNSLWRRGYLAECREVLPGAHPGRPVVLSGGLARPGRAARWHPGARLRYPADETDA